VKSFFKILLPSLALLFPLTAGSSAAEMPARPNVLFIAIDDMNVNLKWRGRLGPEATKLTNTNSAPADAGPVVNSCNLSPFSWCLSHIACN
jgi:hypothetical protein